ncbi:hypothetical protein [Goodfellowiella coeruleoviolacea]|uniref:Uncharacterized protein n=1 Tax=Goodfellowiella coeruleoviolacea TaxID=334858 RepID=A0AAE3GEN0_9PSEU|nr:hypothetical protein [Goodfellowiella coeruleoviolacea]MCP2166862.1 hypothetical protein [Goodfellowiella coeruleoviolacea]
MTWIVIVCSIAALVGAAAVVYGMAGIDRTTHKQPRHRRTPTRQARPTTSPHARHVSTSVRRPAGSGDAPSPDPATQAYTGRHVRQLLRAVS